MDDVALALRKIMEFEGTIPWMYGNAAGEVTVGAGMVLKESAAAERLPFRVGEGSADAGEIAAEFARVSRLPMGRAALFYRKAGAPELGAVEIEELARTVVAGMREELASRVEGFGEMPDGARVALLDMAYGLGVDGLLKAYPRLIRAAQAGAWGHVAGGSFRHGAGAARNAWTRETFLESVTETGGDGRVKRLGYGCLGMVASWFGK